VSEYIDVMLGIGPLYQELHDVFDDDYAPTPVHRLLAKLPRIMPQQPRRPVPRHLHSESISRA
jgi:hypothetical protein